MKQRHKKSTLVESQHQLITSANVPMESGEEVDNTKQKQILIVS
jgi:hypothetical protein